MSISIGSVTFDIMRGHPDHAGSGLDVLARKGRDYERYRLIGERSQPTELACTAFAADVVSASTHEAACRALQGTSVTITDAMNVQYTSCIVLNVKAIRRRCIVNGTAKVRIDSVFTVMANS